MFKTSGNVLAMDPQAQQHISISNIWEGLFAVGSTKYQSTASPTLVQVKFLKSLSVTEFQIIQARFLISKCILAG